MEESVIFKTHDSGAAAPGVAPVSGVVASGVTPVYSAAASGVAPVSGAVAPCVAPVTCVASGVAPSSGVAASDKDTAPMVISEVAVVAAPITPHEFVPGTNIDNSTRQISLSNGNLDAQTHDFGSPSKKFKKPFPVSPSSSKEPSSQTFKRRARPNARRRRQLVAVSRIPLSIWLALVFVQVWTGVFKVC